MKTAIVGSRPKWMKRPAVVRERVWRYVMELPADSVVVSGGAAGVDTWAAMAARERGLVVVEYLADWEANRRAAGFIRNQLIVDQSDEIVAFWDGKSPGTRDTIKRARAALKDVTVIRIEER